VREAEEKLRRVARHVREEQDFRESGKKRKIPHGERAGKETPPPPTQKTRRTTGEKEAELLLARACLGREGRIERHKRRGRGRRRGKKKAGLVRMLS